MPGAAALLQTGTFPQMVVALHRSDISQHSHPHVLMLYYDITVRYVKILKQHRELIPCIMEAMCGRRGLSNPHRPLRARACYNLSRLVKALGSEMVSFVDAVVPTVAELLQAGATQGELSEESILNLYETLGCLIGMQGVPPERRAVYLEGVLRPLLNRVHAMLAQTAAIAADPDAAGEALAFCLAGLANVSKGFSKAVPDLSALHSQELDASVACVLALPAHLAVRAKAIMLMHRMVPLLGETMLQQCGTAVMALITQCKGVDMEEVVTLLNQFALAFSAAAAPLIDVVLLPLIRTIYELLPPAVPAATGSAATSTTAAGAAAAGKSNGTAAAAALAAPLSHEVVERTVLLRHYFSFLNHIINNGLLGVLASPANAPQLDAILQSVVEALVELDDPLAKKACAGVLAALVKELADETPAAAALPAHMRAAVAAYAAERAAPAVLRALLAPTFDIKDANSISAITQMGALLHGVRRLSGGSLDFLLAALQQVTQQQRLETQASELVAVIAAAQDGAGVGKALRGFAAQVRKIR
jgi:Exportin-T